MSGAIRNWGRWSAIDAARLPEIEIGVLIFEKKLSVRVLEQYRYTEAQNVRVN